MCRVSVRPGERHQPLLQLVLVHHDLAHDVPVLGERTPHQYAVLVAKRASSVVQPVDVRRAEDVVLQLLAGLLKVLSLQPALPLGQQRDDHVGL